MAKKVQVSIIGDASSLQRAFGKAGDAGSAFGRRVAGLGKVAAAGLVVAGAGAVTLGTKLVGLAGDAAEVDSKMGVVFGKTLPGLKKDLDKFADATGASSYKLREQAADLGALLGPLTGSTKATADMSEQFVKLATDLGSFNNVPVDDALLAIRSGLVGEAEPLRKFGVLLNEAAVKAEGLRLGLVKGKEEMTEQQKVQARASLIMKQTAQAQGDAERTAGSYANQVKALRNNITDLATGLGVKLLPAATAVAGGLNDFIDKISKADGASAKLGVVVDTVRGLASKAWDALKAAFNAIDWAAVWDRLVAVWKAEIQFIWTTVKSAISAIDWGAVGKVVGDLLVNGLNKLDTFIKSVDWNRVGEALVSGFKAAVRAVASFLAAIDWRAVIGKTLSIAVGVLRAGATVWLTVAKALGLAVIHGVVAGMEGIATWVRGKLDDARQAVVNAAAYAYGNALAIGKNIVKGVVSGMDSLKDWLVQKAKDIALAPYNAMKGALGIESPSKLFAGLGVETVAGFILGMTSKVPELKGKAAEAVGQALEAARDKVASYQERFGDVFGKLGDFAARAFEGKTQSLLDKIDAKFDAKIARWQAFADALTPAEQALAKIDKAEGERARTGELQAAQAELASAQSIADANERATAIVAAEERLRLAQLAITRARLEETAVVERTKREESAAAHIAALEETRAREERNLEERRRQLGMKLDEQLVVLQGRLAKHPEEHDKIQRKIVKLLNSYGVDMKTSGENLGKAFARGLDAAQDDVRRSAQSLARIVAQYLQTHSPTEKGPMASLDTWWEAVPSTLAGGINNGELGATLNRAAPSRSGGGGGTTISVTIQGGQFFGTNMDRAADDIQSALLRKKLRTGSLGLA